MTVFRKLFKAHDAIMPSKEAAFLYALRRFVKMTDEEKQALKEARADSINQVLEYLNDAMPVAYKATTSKGRRVRFIDLS